MSTLQDYLIYEAQQASFSNTTRAETYRDGNAERMNVMCDLCGTEGYVRRNREIAIDAWGIYGGAAFCPNCNEGE